MSAMIEHPGFLQDIIAHPDDDAPRLIYADWLDDQGQSARAEFIRLQCELASRLGEGLGEQRRLLQAAPQAVARDVRELLLAEQAMSRLVTRQWYLPREVYRDTRVWMDVARGFLVRVGLTLSHWHQVGPWLVRHQPLLGVHLVNRAPSATPPALAQVGRWRWQEYVWWGCLYREIVERIWNQSPQSHLIPGPIFRHLVGKDEAALYDNLAQVTYQGATAQDRANEAQDDLSQACLRWAREQPCPQ